MKEQPYTVDHLLNNPTQRLRVGYVSADFKDHPTAHLMQSIPGFNREHQVIELTCYCLCPNDNSVYRRKNEGESEHFVDLSAMPSPLHAADRIYADGCHVLLNLNGYVHGPAMPVRKHPVRIRRHAL